MENYFSCTLSEKNIMKTKIFLICMMMLMASYSADTRMISGTVTDALTGDPVIGAAIELKGSPYGTVSGTNGEFSLEVPLKGGTLIISYAGYVTREIEITELAYFKIEISENVAALEEVVVIKPHIPGTATEIHSEDMRVTQNTVQGKVAGVSTGENNIQIRGINSNTPSDQYIINSEPGDINSLEPDEVESIYVIKEASSSSVYGSRAAVSRYTPAGGFVQKYPENTESYAPAVQNGFRNPLKEPISTFSIDVDAASYSNVRRFITEGQMPVPEAVRIEEMINYFDYDYPQPDDNQPFSITTETGVCPWNRENYLLHIGIQGENMNRKEIPPSNLVFLVDISGSMDSPEKLPLLKNALKLLTGQLRENDRVAIVYYNETTGVILPSTPGYRKDIILRAIERLQAGGSTAGAAGLKLAYSVAEQNFIARGNNRVIIATDGDFNVGPSSNQDMERMITYFREKGIYISVTGFGMGNYQDDKMEIIADKGNGNYAYIDNLMEAKKVFMNEFTGTLYTIAKDVKIQIEFNPAFVKEYRLIGYENRMLHEEDFNNDRKDAGELGAGHTVTALYEIVPAEGNSERVLKYQSIIPSANGSAVHELATVMFRYKKPGADESILMTRTINNHILPLNETSDNFRFSAAVAGFGMILRDPECLNGMDYYKILELARNSRGNDENGYRSEFIDLVELCENMSGEHIGYRGR
jgi:Ca-activated chloride channel homolog